MEVDGDKRGITLTFEHEDPRYRDWRRREVHYRRHGRALHDRDQVKVRVGGMGAAFALVIVLLIVLIVVIMAAASVKTKKTPFTNSNSNSSRSAYPLLSRLYQKGMTDLAKAMGDFESAIPADLMLGESYPQFRELVQKMQATVARAEFRSLLSEAQAKWNSVALRLQNIGTNALRVTGKEINDSLAELHSAALKGESKTQFYARPWWHRQLWQHRRHGWPYQWWSPYSYGWSPWSGYYSPYDYWGPWYDRIRW